MEAAVGAYGAGQLRRRLRPTGERLPESMRHVITGLPHAFGSYALDGITLSAEVSARGRVSLLGSGGEVAGNAGITFKFTKRDIVGDESPSESA